MTNAPADLEGIGTETLLGMHRTMVTIRGFEEMIFELHAANAIRGAAHPYIGMEAVAVGACTALGPDDMVTSTHRGHGHAIAKGLDLERMFAEILGRRTGYCGGKGGSMHITSLPHGMLGADGIVGGSLGLAVGAAYGKILAGASSVVVSFFGDGGANQGLFHEAANIAAVMDAPVVFLCENNQWALFTPVEATKRVRNISDRAAAYGFPGETIDGNDVAAVYHSVEGAVARAREGHGPSLVEAVTYRVSPHSAFMNRELRSQEELEHWRSQDPIPRFERALVKAEVAAEEDLRAQTESVYAEVALAAEAALAADPPDEAAAFEDVYAPTGWLGGLA